jgi:hypothetical protein
MSINDLYLRFSKTRQSLPNTDDIAVFENAIQKQLPDDFKKFLLEYNGGVFDNPYIYAHSDVPFRDRLDVLFSLNSSEKYADLLGSTYLFDDNIPCILLPFGYTISGNLLVLDFLENVNGTVLLKIASSNQFYHFATSFTEFMELCVIDAERVTV